jgi:AcrR family transcriptional regulator
LNKKSQLTNSQIIQAALAVAADKGAGKVTLDAVAKVAGVSKGGLIYHFPSKEALISAMVQHLLDEAESKRSQQAQLEPSTLAAVLQTRAHFTAQISGNTAMAILAAAAEQPSLLKPVQQHNQEVLRQIQSEHGDSLQATLLLLASEALIYHDLLNLSPFTAAERRILEQQLVQQARELQA